MSGNALPQICRGPAVPLGLPKPGLLRGLSNLLSMEKIHLEFQWSEADFRDVQWYALRSRLFTKRMVILFAVVFAWSLTGQGDIASISWAGVAGICLGLALGFPVLWMVMRLTCWLTSKYSFKRARLSHLLVAYTLDSYGLEISTQHSDSKVKWSMFDSWGETDRLILFKAGLLYYGIPKSALSLESMSELKNLLTERIGPTA